MRRIGDKVSIRGGVNHRIMTYGTPDEVRQEVKQCLEVFAAGGGYMLSPNAATWTRPTLCGALATRCPSGAASTTGS